MLPSNAISLSMTPSKVADYCGELSRRQSDPAKRVAAIDALITFVSSQTDAADQVRPEFVAIKETLHLFLEQAREQLLDEHAERLYQALRTQSLPRVGLVYTSLSRDGFRGVFQRIEARFTADELCGVRQWASSWLGEARQKAEQASSYPDALNLSAAGIDASEYLAMADLCCSLGVDTEG